MKTNYRIPESKQQYDSYLENLAVEAFASKKRFFRMRILILSETKGTFSFGRKGQVCRVSFGYHDEGVNWTVSTYQGKDNPTFHSKWFNRPSNELKIPLDDAVLLDKIEVTKYK